MCRVYARSHFLPQDPHGRNRRGNSSGVGYTEFINSDLCVFITTPVENASQILRTRVGRDSCGMCCRGSCDWHASQAAAYNPRRGTPRSEVVDLSRDGTTRGIEKGPQSPLTKDAGELILELPPLSPEGRYRVTLQSENGRSMASGAGIAKTQNGKTELPVMMNLSGLPSGDYKLAIQGEHDSASYYYHVVLR